MSRERRITLFIIFSTSSIVFIEPAPFDALVAVFFLVVITGGHITRSTISWQMESLLSLFLLSNILSLVAVPLIDPDRSVSYFMITVYMLTLFFLTAWLVAEHGGDACRAILAGTVVAAMVGALAGCIGILFHTPIDHLVTQFGRAQGFFKDPNVFGPYVAAATVYLLLEAANPNRRLLLAILVPIGVTAVLLSGSRAAWVGSVASVLVFVSVRIYQLKGTKSFSTSPAVVVLGGAAMLIGAMALLPTEHATSIIANRTALQGYDAARFGTQEAAASLASRSPLGMGPGQSDRYFSVSPHSLFVRAFVENGWLGLSALCTFLVVTMWRGLINCRRTAPLQAVSAALLAVFVASLLQSAVVDTLHWRHFWVQCGLIWGISSYVCKRTRPWRAARAR